jgi:integrase
LSGTKRREYGDGSIRQRSDELWEGALERGKDATGKRVRQYAYGETRAEVKAKLRYLCEGEGHSESRKGQPRSVESYLIDWLAEVKENNRLSTWRIRKRQVEKAILPSLPRVKGRPLHLHELTPDHIRSMLTVLGKNQRGIPTRAQALATLKTALNVAVDREYIYRNPCRGIRPPRGPRKELRVLTEEQTAAFLLEARKSQFYPLFVLAINLGLRQGELFALTWDAIDLETGTLAVKATLTEDENGQLVLTEPKTEKSRRLIQLSRISWDLLVSLKEVSADKIGLVFSDGEGKPLRKSNFLRREFHPLLKNAGVPKVSFHSLRHRAITFYGIEGIDSAWAHSRFGHSDIRTTLGIYTHLRSSSVERSMADVGDKIMERLISAGDKMAEQTAAFATPWQPSQKKKTRNALQQAGLDLVEMRRLELLTPYMRSKCSTS